MSNHIYTAGAFHNDHHKELTINGNLTEQQMELIANGFFSDEEEEKVEEKEKEEEKEEVENAAFAEEAKTAQAEETTRMKAAPSLADEPELFHFLHPALEDEEDWKVHREVERLVKRFDIQLICSYLSKLANENKLLLPQNVKTAYDELVRMGMPEKKSGFSYKNFEKYYHK